MSGGWVVEHSTLPWKEGRPLEFNLVEGGWVREAGSSTVGTADVLPAVLPIPTRL